jgi:hypothetical protein
MSGYERPRFIPQSIFSASLQLIALGEPLLHLLDLGGERQVQLATQVGDRDLLLLDLLLGRRELDAQGVDLKLAASLRLLSI